MISFQFKPTDKEFSDVVKQDARDYFLDRFSNSVDTLNDLDVVVTVDLTSDGSNEANPKYLFNSSKLSESDMFLLISKLQIDNR